MGAAATATRTSCCEGPRPHARFAHIANRIGCVVGRAVKDALATKVGTADKPERLYSDGPLPPAEHRGCAHARHAYGGGVPRAGPLIPFPAAAGPTRNRAANRAGPLVLPVLPPRPRGGGGARSEPKGWAGRRRHEARRCTHRRSRHERVPRQPLGADAEGGGLGPAHLRPARPELQRSGEHHTTCSCTT